MVLPEGVMVVQVIKRYTKRRVKEVVLRRVVQGTEALVQARVEQTQSRCAEAVINTAYIRAA